MKKRIIYKSEVDDVKMSEIGIIIALISKVFTLLWGDSIYAVSIVLANEL